MIAPQMPTWVWTAEDIDSKSLDELKTYFYDYFKDGNKVRFCAKPNIADILSEPFITLSRKSIESVWRALKTKILFLLKTKKL